MKTLIILLVMTCWSSQSVAGRTFGLIDCGQWVDQNTRMHAKSWLGGYLSGLNEMWDTNRRSPSNPLAKLDSLAQATLWMDNYCKANPLNNLVDAGDELFFELVKKAKKQ